MSQINGMADIRVASVLSGLDEDRKIAAQTNRASRVKIEKGHAWLLRFLPFPMGKRGLPWARIGAHWISKTPCYCKQNTSPDFGGDPNFVCPVCEVTDTMHSQADSDADRDDFYQCQVRLAWTMWCIVFAKEDDRGRQEEMTEEETLTPYEFNIPKAAWQTFSAKLERSKSRKGGDDAVGFLSLENGCDIWVAKDKKNAYSFDLSDTGYGPIFELDDRYEAKLVRIWKQLRQPSVKFHDDARLNATADMLAERAFKQAADSLSERRSGGRSRDDDDDRQLSRGSGRLSRSSRGEEQEAPARQAAPPARQARQVLAPVRQTAPARQPNRFAVAQAALDEADGGAPPVDDSDQVPGAEVPPVDDGQNDTGMDGQGDPQEVPQEAPPAPPVRRASTRPAPQSEDDGSSAVDQSDAPAVRRQAGATPRQAAPPAVAAARRMGPAPVSAGVAPRSVARPSASTAQGGKVEEDPEELPEEANDPAPPPSQTAPPAPAPARSDALAGRLGSRLAAIKKNQG
jgi:hypothetical protein